MSITMIVIFDSIIIRAWVARGHDERVAKLDNEFESVLRASVLVFVFADDDDLKEWT